MAVQYYSQFIRLVLSTRLIKTRKLLNCRHIWECSPIPSWVLRVSTCYRKYCSLSPRSKIRAFIQFPPQKSFILPLNGHSNPECSGLPLFWFIQLERAVNAQYWMPAFSLLCNICFIFMMESERMAVVTQQSFWSCLYFTCTVLKWCRIGQLSYNWEGECSVSNGWHGFRGAIVFPQLYFILQYFLFSGWAPLPPGAMALFWLRKFQ